MQPLQIGFSFGRQKVPAISDFSATAKAAA
jgi:hypothetical protein